MSEVKEETQYKIINHAILIITTLCSGDRDTAIDMLTGYLWDEEEAGQIKESKS